MPQIVCAEMHCVYCETLRRCQLWSALTANGGRVVFWRCETCLHRPSRRNVFVSKAKLWRDHDLLAEDLPRLYDHREFACEVLGCNEPGADLHHWAPTAIWGETADHWPTALLCPKHHAEWHLKISAALLREC